MTNHPIERETHPMVERAARWMLLALDGIEHDTRVGELTTREVVGLAQFALMSLRDLTPDVVEAGLDITGRDYVGHGFDSDMTDPEEVFTAMINTIIGESA